MTPSVYCLFRADKQGPPAAMAPAPTKVVLNVYQMLGLLFLLALSVTVLLEGTRMLEKKEGEDVVFSGPRWHHPGETIEARELLTGKYARVESHTLQTATGNLIKGWIWADFHDRVDVLVEDERGSFLLFDQYNYGLPKRSLAVLSSRIQTKESPAQAARRALAMYMARESTRWIFLGRFRTDANRGGGFVYCYLVRGSQAIAGKTPELAEVMEPKTMVRLSRKQLQEAVIGGRFLEAKWGLTASLGLLRINLDIWDAVATDGLADVEVVVGNGAGGEDKAEAGRRQAGQQEVAGGAGAGEVAAAAAEG